MTIPTTVKGEYLRATAAEQALSDRIASLEADVSHLTLLIGTGSSASMYTRHVYGPAMAYDSNQNHQIGSATAGILSYRWRASVSSTVTSVIAFYRPGIGYSAGTQGILRVGIKADDGAGKPTGAYLTSTDFNASVVTSGYYIVRVVFGSPVAVTAGHLYHMVWTNVDASPSANYISINSAYVFDTVVPRQPAFTDASFASLYSTSGGAFVESAHETPIVDIEYATGDHDGQGYIDPYQGTRRYITGTTTMMREHFTVSGGDRTVTQVYVRAGRISGTDVLSIRLETGAGVAIETVTVPAASVTVVTDPVDGAHSVGNWVGATFASSHVLTNGQTYNLRYSTASTSRYVADPMYQRDFGDDGTHYTLSRKFLDGAAQYTTDSGSTWPAVYAFQTTNTQCYFVTA